MRYRKIRYLNLKQDRPGVPACLSRLRFTPELDVDDDFAEMFLARLMGERVGEFF